MKKKELSAERVKVGFQPKKLAAVLLGTAAAAALGGVFSMRATEVYHSLLLPSFAPPASLFPIVWPVLYLLMAYAAYRVAASVPPGQKDARAKSVLSAYALQLFFNVLWSFLFFAAGYYAAALLDLLILLFYIAVTMARFYKIDRLAGILMLPYLLWVVFAGVLNAAVVLLNR